MNKFVMFFIGGLNGLFGSGGGSILVPYLEKTGLEEKKAHATSIVIILFFSCITIFLYSRKVDIDFSVVFKLWVGGIIGGVIGSKLLSKLTNKTIRKIFSVILIIVGVRLLF